MPYSHHSHSGQFCSHAAGTLEEVVLEAIQQGFEVYGLTEHVPRYRTQDLYPEEKGTPLSVLEERFTGFLDEAHRLKTKYAAKIKILVGLETEFVSQLDLDRLQGIIDQNASRIQYLVGSIHHVNEIPVDFDRATFEKSLDSCVVNTDGDTILDPQSLRYRQMEVYLCSYFDAQYELLRRFKPEVIGHIDLCRLYNPALRLADYPDAWNKLGRNVQFAVNYGALFEVNAAALRKGWADPYPATDVVKVIQDYSGRFTLSDDSHGPHAVGLNYGSMAAYIRRAGINELWILEDNKTCAAGRSLDCRRVDGDWWEHAWWTRYKSDNII